MRSGYTILEHPADVGIKAYGSTFAEALVQAAAGLMSIILDTATVLPRESRQIEITASDAGQLVVKWLSEILFLYDGKNFVAKEFVIYNITGTSLRAEVRGESFDSGRHHTRLDVKAITYHQLQVTTEGDASTISVYLDI